MAGMAGMEAICTDLAAEHQALDDVVAALDEPGWDTATPAEGWAVRDQISHLGFFDRTATQAALDPDAFTAGLADIATDPVRFSEQPLHEGRSRRGDELLTWWRTGRVALLSALGDLDPKARIPWYGPPMSAVSFATARLMETWAHGQDVVDALGATRTATDRLRHVCHIGARALPFSYVANGRPVPDAPVRVELTGPFGDAWAWGPEDAADVVRGSALDFALLVTQRRHRDDTDVTAEGSVATEWVSIAQAFAGPPGAGRQPGQHAPPA